MIDLEQIKKALRQAEDLLSYASDEESKKEIKKAIEINKQMILLFENLDMTKLSDKSSKAIEGAIQTVQDLYNKIASN